MGSLWSDIRFGLRMLAKNAGFTATAVLILALGIGVNTAIFSLVDNVLFRPLPVERPSELVNIGRRGTAKELPGASMSWPMYLEYRDNSGSSFVGLAAYYDGTQVNLSQSKENNISAVATLVTGNYFELLGVHVIRGRTIVPEDDRSDRAVAVVSYRYWKDSLGGRADAVGATVRISGVPYMIIGIAPSGFFGIGLDSVPDVWLPMSAAPNISSLLRTQMQVIENPFFRVFGRLKPGVNLTQASQQLNAVAGHLGAGKIMEVELASAPGHPPRTDQWEKPWPSLELADSTKGLRSKDQMLLILGAVVLLLLLVVSDLASLLLARLERRRREMAIRMALGASRWQIASVLAVEGLLLSIFGAAVGLIIAHWSLTLMGAMVSTEVGLPLTKATSLLDARVLGFNALIALLSGLIFSLAPAIQAGRSSVMSVMNSETPASAVGRPRAALRGGLTIFQIAASAMLLSSALLFLQTYLNDSRVKLAFDPNRILVLAPRTHAYNLDDSDDAQKALLANLLETVRTVPGVRAAAAGSPLKLGTSVGMGIEGRWYYKSRITPGFFSVLNMPILRGRDFTAQDRAGASYVAIVNEKMAHKFWPGKEAVGQHLEHVLMEDRTVEIVGVVPDTRKEGVGDPEDPILYVPLDQFYSAYPYKLFNLIVVRGDGNDPLQLLPSIRSAVKKVDKTVTLEWETAADVLARRSEESRFRAELIGTSAVLALTLAAVGLYGLISYITLARTREFGVRIALGASRRDVMGLILRDAILKAFSGIAIGFLLEIALMRFLETFLYGVWVADAQTLGIVALILFCVAIAASYVPARRASRLDLMVTLRCD